MVEENSLNFTGRNVPIAEIAKATGKSSQYIRVGIQKGVLKFGYALKMDNSSKFDYYIPDYLLYKYTGYYNPDITAPICEDNAEVSV